MNDAIAHTVERERRGQRVAPFVAHAAQSIAAPRHASGQFARRAVELHATVFQQQHGVATFGLVEVRRRPDDRHAFACQRLHHGQQFAPTDRIDANTRLIEQQHVRLRHQRACESELLFHATGEFAGATIDERLEPREVQQLRECLFQRPTFRRAQFCIQPQVLDDGKVFVEAKPLRHVTGIDMDRIGERDDVASTDANTATRRRHQRRDDAYQRRFARAIGPNEPGEARGADVCRHAPQRFDVAEALDDVADFDRGAQLNPRLIEARSRPSPASPAAVPHRRQTRRCAVDTRDPCADLRSPPTSG